MPRRMRIECDDNARLEGFVLGLVWVDDSAIEILDVGDNFVLLEDMDENEIPGGEYVLTETGVSSKEESE